MKVTVTIEGGSVIFAGGDAFDSGRIEEMRRFPDGMAPPASITLEAPSADNLGETLETWLEETLRMRFPKRAGAMSNAADARREVEGLKRELEAAKRQTERARLSLDSSMDRENRWRGHALKLRDYIRGRKGIRIPPRLTATPDDLDADMQRGESQRGESS